ncbi:hypothetical protein HN695_02530 [Candidatus Woesearchaeota archaeon]|jgi:hypothetical protein|nr:hypothetical protein [Candidatus Woesearchaeota archaeon]MBT5272962.1 hypothetical protein [Candidatus Woesearchaeota archaeon]MBT6041428.1 hypothetical protein [Candidatus Woesearchaeota archaeon]MBT6337311.1 hypothetical protein [Candidatus Woesearchaeota archaeon]MBT7927188.1 hypothetical protein [Candidatus Woesearchaeota archaeon]
MASITETAEYKAEKKFGGPKFAELKLLERVRDDHETKRRGIEFRTIPEFYSPGFGLWRSMMSNGLSPWLKDARMHMGNVWQAYDQVIRGESIDESVLGKAHDFFGLRTYEGKHFEAFGENEFRNRNLGKIKRFINENSKHVRETRNFLERIDSRTLLYRSSMGIEDKLKGTQGLFETYSTGGFSWKPEQAARHIDTFLNANLATSIFEQRPTQMNYILCGYIKSTSGGVCLSSINGKGQHYVELAHDASKITTGSMAGSINQIIGNSEEFEIRYASNDRANKYELPKQNINGTQSFSSETQVRNLLKVIDYLEELYGTNVDVEFLFEEGEEVPTILQIRESPIKRSDNPITDEEWNSADYQVPLVIKPGEFLGIVINSQSYENHIHDYKSEQIAELKKCDQKNPDGYAYSCLLGTISGHTDVSLGKYKVHGRPIDIVTSISKNCKVLINDYDILNKGGHFHLRLTDQGHPEFYMSMPNFNVPDGTRIHARSDGYRGIINVVK